MSKQSKNKRTLPQPIRQSPGARLWELTPGAGDEPGLHLLCMHGYWLLGAPGKCFDISRRYARALLSELK